MSNIHIYSLVVPRESTVAHVAAAADQAIVTDFPKGIINGMV